MSMISNKIVSKKMNDTGLKKMFVEQLKELYSVESHLVKTLPKMEEAASLPKLKSIFSEHAQVTQQHVNRLEKILTEFDEKTGETKCQVMSGLVEAEEVVEKKFADTNIKDFRLIDAAQKVEHYKMTEYGVVHAYAQILGFDDATELLHLTLQEKGQSDKEFTHISYHFLFKASKNQYLSLNPFTQISNLISKKDVYHDQFV